MGFIPQYGRPAMIPDTWLEFAQSPKNYGFAQVKKPGKPAANAGWWQPSMDVTLKPYTALAIAQKKQAPGPSYLNIAAPATSATGSGGDEQC